MKSMSMQVLNASFIGARVHAQACTSKKACRAFHRNSNNIQKPKLLKQHTTRNTNAIDRIHKDEWGETSQITSLGTIQEPETDIGKGCLHPT